jgi:hypothetical protein
VLLWHHLSSLLDHNFIACSVRCCGRIKSICLGLQCKPDCWKQLHTELLSKMPNVYVVYAIFYFHSLYPVCGSQMSEQSYHHQIGIFTTWNYLATWFLVLLQCLSSNCRDLLESVKNSVISFPKTCKDCLFPVSGSSNPGWSCHHQIAQVLKVSDYSVV